MLALSCRVPLYERDDKFGKRRDEHLTRVGVVWYNAVHEITFALMPVFTPLPDKFASTGVLPSAESSIVWTVSD